MNDWYEVLGVPPSASAEEISAAFTRLVPLERDPNESEDAAEERRLREYAYGVLHDPDSRARYDAERTAASAPERQPVGAAAQSPAPTPKGSGGIPLGPLVGAFGILAAICAVVAVAFVFVSNDDDDGARYPNREDEDYDLEAMRLRDADMPAGFLWTNSVEFTNEEWVPLFFSQEELDDPESVEPEMLSKQRQLEAEGRVRNLLSVYQSEDLGRTLGIFAISTLYADDEHAAESLTLYCGLPVDERRTLEPPPRQIVLPNVGDESAGFIAPGVMSSPLYRETTFCFRTGRIVHAISLASLPGVEDIGLAVRLAEDMENRVQAFYNGEEPPEDANEQEQEEDDGGG
ncbi:MAG: J domain-containing protein [Dehalococcoidia bacterium]